METRTLMRPPPASLAALLCFAIPTFAGQVIFHEVMYHPLPGKPEFLEIVNLTSNRIDTANWKLSDGVEYTFPAFNPAAASAHFLNEYERIVLSSDTEAATRAAYPNLPPNVRVLGPWTGSLNNTGETVTLRDFAGALQSTLTYGDNGQWPRAADGTGHSLQIINQNRNVDDWRNWRASKSSSGTPGYTDPASAEELTINPEINVGTTFTVTQFNDVAGTGTPSVPAPANPGDTQWRFYNQAAAPPADWMQSAFVETGWGGPGHAPLGTENAAAPFIGIRTQVPQVTNLITYYYRTTFNWTGPLTGNSFSIDQVLDDGAIYYLNGQEIGRDRMPNAEGHGNTADPTAVGDAVLESGRVSGGALILDGKLVSGTNTLAVSVHQNQGTSSDHVFAARLKITTAAPPGVVINEVKPGPAGNGFVEFYNPTASAVDLQGFYLSDVPGNLTKFQIATSLVVPPTGLATIGFSESSLGLASPVVVILTQPDGQTRQAHLSSSMTIDGRSLGRKPVGSASWYLFTSPTPGAANVSAGSGDASPVRLNEVHFDVNGVLDWVEVANIGAESVSGASLYVSSLPDLTDKVAVGGSLGAGAFVSVNVSFPTDGGELTLYLADSSNNILGTAEIVRRAGLSSVQAWPNGSGEWYAAATDTRDATNNPARSTDIVINEIMFDPPSKHTAGEFIELTNRGAATVNLTGWRFTRGLDYDFPAGTTIAPGEFIVVAKDPAFITANYAGGIRVFGPAEGKLGNNGDYLRLEDANENLADVVDYEVGGNWPSTSGGGGSSLELRHPDMDNSQPSSWRASNESAKSTFQPYTFTGTYKQLRGAPTADTGYKELLLNLVGDGYLVLKSVSLTRAAVPATNVIVNGDATSHTGNSANGFLCMGTHRLSDTIGGEFHLISQGSGDTKANKAEVDVTAIQLNDTLTFSCQARWVSGMPLLVVQTWDRSFGKVLRLPIPNNLGTPGAANSVAAPAAAPTVDGIRHSPPVPTSSQPVVVTARVSSSTAIGSVALRERLDSVAGNAAWNTLAMNDSGSGGDDAAGDGIWSVSVPPRADGSITQFYVRATAVNGQVNECPRGAEGVTGVNGSVLGAYGKPAMWIVDNSPPSTQPGTLIERYVFSQYDRNAMNTGTGFSAAYDFDFPRMSNFGLNATIILNESDILYNSELRKGGSPWTRNDGSSMERARWKPPGDDLFRNRSKFAIDSDGSATNAPARFHNRITRYMMHLLGYPVPDAEFVQQIVNGDAPGWRDNMEMTDSDFFDRAYGDGGELYEIDDAWYMYDTGNHNDRLSADTVTGKWWLTDWATPGTAFNANPSDESPIYFHGNWPIRFPEVPYDYASLSSFIKVAYNSNSGFIANEPLFREQMERMIDTNRAAIYTAVRGYVGDWDNFTLNRGKNGYLYRRPTDGKFEFHHWDSDLAFQNTSEAWIGSIGGTGWSNLANRPWFRSRFNFYLTELVTKYTGGSPRMNAWLAAMNYQASNPHANAPFKTAAYNYPSTWFAARDTGALNFVNAINHSRVFAVSTLNNQTVSNPVFSLDGQANTRTAMVDIAGHPEAILTWAPTAANQGLWNLSNITLVNGLNALTVRAVGSDGTILATVNFNVTLSVNAPPAVVMIADPLSRRVAANELLVLDATASYDPEGTPLAFSWSVTPSTGVTLTTFVPGQADIRFTIPGLYTVTVTVTDGANINSATDTEVTVFNGNDFQSFSGGLPLGPQFTVQNAELRDNFSTASWYSVEDTSGRLLIQVLDDSAKPLASPAYTHPVITRDLPDNSDFVLQTDLEPDTREFGNWQTGLWLEMIEGGTVVRYTLSLDGGLNVVVRRAVQPAAWTQSATVAASGSGATLRIRRSDTSLIFQRLNGALWTTVFTQSIPAGSVGGTGGIFVATSLATTTRVSFDYLLVSDPAATNSVLANLRITEIMYNPNGPGGIEFIELTNTGTQAIDLTGVYFEEGRPFAQFTFPAYSLAPGAFVIVTNVTPAAFSIAYPATPPASVFQWGTGNLSNGGEEIVLRDSFGNIIQQFSFDDEPLSNWPLPPDGGGASLEVVNTSGDYSNAANWSSSAEIGGSPGWTGLGPDSDNDGYSDRLEQIAGTDPANGAMFFNAASQLLPGGHKITWPSYPGRTYRIQTCPDLTSGNWTLSGTVTHPTGNPAGIGEFTVTSPAPANALRTFYRVLVEITP
jgi:hypothetical protein